MEFTAFMKKAPIIVMQLVHIQGPMKGEIQEFSGDSISIGRHPSCEVQFPKDLDILSRKHARIIREGNRFKLIDQSTNGTFLNGKPVSEAFLNNGDILLFADGGPKVSFLTKLVESPADLPPAPEKPPARMKPPQPPPPTDSLSLPPEKPAAEMKIERTQMPLIIQYGPTLRTFKELPVTLGRNPACDFSIDHPGLLDQHAQFFFSRDQYWIKDLTGKNLIAIDGSPINFQAVLHPQCQVSLSSRGPRFRFLGAGRLAEIEESPPPEPNIPSRVPKAPSSPAKKSTKAPKAAKKIIDKFFKS
jgi:pSer/pThr/pTyr-binding forkhead associated (FHA) protein